MTLEEIQNKAGEIEYTVTEPLIVVKTNNSFLFEKILVLVFLGIAEILPFWGEKPLLQKVSADISNPLANFLQIARGCQKQNLLWNV